MKWKWSHQSWSKSWLVGSRSLTARSMQSLIRFRYCKAGQIYRQKIASNYWGKSRTLSEGPTSNSKMACWVMFSTIHLRRRQLYSKFLVKSSKCQITKMKSSKVKRYHGTCKWSYTRLSVWSTFSHCRKCSLMQKPFLKKWSNTLTPPLSNSSMSWRSSNKTIQG